MEAHVQVWIALLVYVPLGSVIGVMVALKGRALSVPNYEAGMDYAGGDTPLQVALDRHDRKMVQFLMTCHPDPPRMSPADRERVRSLCGEDSYAVSVMRPKARCHLTRRVGRNRSRP